jgi:ABC-type uncharacterized transport system substrate-binding protein
VNPNAPNGESGITEAQAGARSLGLQLVVLTLGSEREFESAFVSLAQRRVDALIAGGDALFLGRRQQIIALAARHAIPAVYDLREYVADGGLMSY